ncbi:MAG TPA: PsiF family protein [Casimicrobiaceae bacterium]|nr:PsiF family protein [Casimicrobiaceae bacterium]
MKTLSARTLALLLGFAAPAFADDTATTKARSGKVQTSAVSGDGAGAPKISQQDKMRQCAKQATGRKGAGRKAFMKGCLSKNKPS